MTRVLPALLLLLSSFAISGCGADGEPVRPTANVGVGVSNSGAHPGANVGLSKGPWTVTWGQYL